QGYASGGTSFERRSATGVSLRLPMAANSQDPEDSDAPAQPAHGPERQSGFPLPEPVWRVDRRARSKPRLPLTRDAIVDAAIRVLDRDGLDGMSMHRVAQELGTGAGSLYWHVRNKGELLQL